MKTFCPNCEVETEQDFIEETKELNIRGEGIPVKLRYFHCEQCGENYEMPLPDYDPLESAYREYRSRKGLLQPEEMREFRKGLGLTQKEWSRILGIGLATLNRYENGMLQSEAHDQAIRLCMQPDNLLRILKDKPSLLPEPVRAELLRQINQERLNSNDLLEDAVARFAVYPPDVNSGYKSFDVYRFFQCVKFFCYQDGILKTKLMKLLFYADFLHFKLNEVSITGARYAHAPHGPVPDQFETWLTALVDWKKEIVYTEQSFGNHMGEAYISGEPDWPVFSASELAALATVKDKFEQYNASRIREYSHCEKGYQETKDGEIISYRYARDLHSFD